MPFVKGKPKTGGRKKGVQNKRKQELHEKAEALGVDPFEVLLMFAKGDWQGLGYDSETRTCFTAAGIEFEEAIIKPEHRVKAATEACQYLFPKRKAIEVSGPDGGAIPVENTVNTSELTDEQLKALISIYEKSGSKA